MNRDATTLLVAVVIDISKLVLAFRQIEQF
jgi:hypothetical protein